MFICSYNFDRLLQTLARVLHGCNAVSPRDLETKEILNANMEIIHPCMCILANNYRKQNLAYLLAELKWYLSGQKQILPLVSLLAKQWGNIVDDHGETNSAYGWQLFTQTISGGKGTQYQYILDKLCRDPSTRQAVVNIHQITNKLIEKDVPCTLTIQYFIRSNKIHSVANMRSCDLIWGLCNDVPFFSLLMFKLRQDLMAQGKTYGIGSLYINAGSLHVYGRHFGIVESLANMEREIYIRSQCMFAVMPELLYLLGADILDHREVCPLTDLEGADILAPDSETIKQPEMLDVNIYPVL